jgi:hypothetical protein
VWSCHPLAAAPRSAAQPKTCVTRALPSGPLLRACACTKLSHFSLHSALAQGGVESSWPSGSLKGKAPALMSRQKLAPSPRPHNESSR